LRSRVKRSAKGRQRIGSSAISMPGWEPGWARAAAAPAGRHRGLPAALKEWWRREFGTYNILGKPLEMRARDRTAGGRHQRRANRAKGSETNLKSLRSANKKTASQRPDGPRPQQTRGIHARPSCSAAGDPDTLFGISLKSRKIPKEPTGHAQAPPASIRRHGRSTQATRGLCILQNEPLHFATKPRAPMDINRLV
jgi:hypothetical protein